MLYNIYMQTKLENKMQIPAETRELLKYNFPAYGLVIEAYSIEEAQVKLLELIKNKK